MAAPPAVTTAHTLIAIVGNSDVRVPAEVAARIPGHPTAARPVGEWVLAQLDAGVVVPYATPILPPILRDLVAAGTPPDHLILVATDQPATTEPRYRATDTLPYAELLRRQLSAEQDTPAGALTIPARAIAIEAFKRNPADYATTFPWLRERCAAWLEQAGAAPQVWHLAVTGGTPALTAALLVEGVAAFGVGAQVHYLDRDATQSRTIDMARDLQAQVLRRALRTHVDTHAYAAALALCDPATDTGALLPAILPEPADLQLFTALLRHASERLNANLGDAEAALAGADLTRLPDDERAAIALPPSSDKEEQDAQMLRDIIASARVMYDVRHYFDFITRVATFVDVCLRFVTEHRFGAHFETHPTNGKETLDAWVLAQPDLVAYLEKKKVHFLGIPPSQFVYRRILGFLSKADTAHRPLVDLLCRPALEDLANLRNKSVHEFRDITEARIEAAWGEPSATIIPALRDLATRAGVADAARDPYVAVQRALSRLIES